MPQTSKVSRNNTTIARHPDGSLKRVTLHQTVIFEMGPVREDGSRVLVISNGGWNTVTTQTRLNQCFGESGIPCQYSRAKGVASLRFLTDQGLWVRLDMKHGNALLETVPTMSVLGANCTVRSCQDAFVVVN